MSRRTDTSPLSRRGAFLRGERGAGSDWMSATTMVILGAAIGLWFLGSPDGAGRGLDGHMARLDGLLHEAEVHLRQAAARMGLL